MARGRPAKCPYCGGGSINKGFRKTKTMGKRRIKLCKNCRRKFTPKNQKQGETPGQDEQSQVEGSLETRKGPEPPREAERPSEPAQALAQMFPPPDEQWTS